MTHEIRLRDEFGPRLSDGAEAYRFRVTGIDPYLGMRQCDQVVLDFTGIRSANSSFVNALVSGLFEQHGTAALRKLIFRGCLPTIQVLVQSAVDLGIAKHDERV
ncbi:MAG: STAS-like domain-containing protein [Verrucomicrobiae bacterium]|nr:STAS-like domain-containing protein [Verrucomicrobiae bacterium]